MSAGRVRQTAGALNVTRPTGAAIRLRLIREAYPIVSVTGRQFKEPPPLLVHKHEIPTAWRAPGGVWFQKYERVGTLLR